jgi:hypothetical protein
LITRFIHNEAEFLFVPNGEIDRVAKEFEIPLNLKPIKLAALPYCAGGNRGVTSMRVWMPKSIA